MTPTVHLYHSGQDRLDESTIAHVIALQAQWLIHRPDEAGNDGFLATQFSADELRRIFEKRAVLALSLRAGEPLGFGLMVDISEFTEQYSDGRGTLETTSAVDHRACSYFYQLVVSRDAIGQGHGTRIMEALLSAVEGPVLADVLCAPVSNRKSYEFALQHGFRDIGTLDLIAYRNFGPLQSKVLVREAPGAFTRLS